VTSDGVTGDESACGAVIGAFPTGGYGFGYRSHGLLGTILIIILILWLLGRI